MQGVYLLNSGWAVWENYKSDQAKSRESYQARRVLSFRNLNEFVQAWTKTRINSLASFFLGEDCRIPKHEVEPDSFLEVSTVSFFRAGVEPKWEHPENHNGGSFSLVVNESQDYLQYIYQVVVFTLLGEGMPTARLFCGVRFIDKYLGFGKNLKLKVDFWVSAEGARRQDEVAADLARLMAELKVKEKATFKKHES